MIGYEEKDIQTMRVVLNQIKVEGVEQARYLVMIDNVLNKGKQVQETQEEKGKEAEECR